VWVGLAFNTFGELQSKDGRAPIGLIVRFAWFMIRVGSTRVDFHFIFEFGIVSHVFYCLLCINDCLQKLRSISCEPNIENFERNFLDNCCRRESIRLLIGIITSFLVILVADYGMKYRNTSRFIDFHSA